jgi:RNA polymerase sigma-70 factor (ECF subfamily)
VCSSDLELLFTNYYPDLYRYARNIVIIEPLAEDLVMDVFTRIWESENKLVIKTSLSGYLFTSVHNHCINYLTRKHKRFTDLNPATIEKLNALIPLTDVNDPLECYSVTELSENIEKCIESLPEECKKIFILSRIEGLPNKEIATNLGLSENTVKVQIYRALKKLRILLRDFLPVSKLL